MVLHMSNLMRRGVSIDQAVRRLINRWAILEARELGMRDHVRPSYWQHVRVGLWCPKEGFRETEDGPDIFVETKYGHIIICDGNNVEAVATRLHVAGKRCDL